MKKPESSESKQRKVKWKPEITPNSLINFDNEDSANWQRLDNPLQTILNKDQGMNAENLHKLPNKLSDHLGHLSSSPFLLYNGEFAASS